MGATCCGGDRTRGRKGRTSKIVHSATTEPLLRESEREAVSNLLKYLEEGTGTTSISEDSLYNLCTLAYSDNVDLQRSAALCFSEFSEKLTEPVSETILEPLIHLLVSSDLEVQKASSHALSNLALHGPEENKRTIVIAGALRPLILLLTVPNADVQCNACGCITTLATVEANKVEIVREGAVASLLVLSNSLDLKVQRNAAGALLNLTHIESNRHVLVEAGAISIFVQLLDSSDEDIQFYCAAGLSNLAVHEAYRQAIVDSGKGRVLRSLINLMKSDKEKVCCQACLAIRNLGSDNVNQKLIVEQGGLVALVPLLRSSDTETVTAAVAALRNLSIHNGNETSIIESGALEDLKRLLVVYENPDIQCHAAGTLRNLAAEDQINAILAAGCLEKLAESLKNSRSGSELVIAEICAAMAVLASEESARKCIMELYEGTFYKSVIELMGSSSSDIRYNSAGVIGHLAMNTDYHKHLLKNDPSVIKFVLNFLSSGENNFLHIALWIMAQFSNGDGETKARLRSPSVVEKMAEIKKSRTSSVDVLELAESTLVKLLREE